MVPTCDGNVGPRVPVRDVRVATALTETGNPSAAAVWRHVYVPGANSELPRRTRTKVGTTIAHPLIYVSNSLKTNVVRHRTIIVTIIMRQSDWSVLLCSLQ
jgi:hypothetical protein